MSTALQLKAHRTVLLVRALRKPGPGTYYLYLEIPTALIYGPINAWINSVTVTLNAVFSPLEEPWVTLTQKGGGVELKIDFAYGVELSEIATEVHLLERLLQESGIHVWLEYPGT